ncbi:MAG TPA: PilN domain-containing protein [Polyangiales bacterium]|jgi:type IV pilus assembly protein PilN
MIRINLLPEAKRVQAASGSTQMWGIAYLLSTFAWCVVLTLFYLNYKSTLEEQTKLNGDLETQISQVKGKSANIGEVEAALAKSRQLEEVVSKLQSARQGPARVLMELSRMLSEGGGPAVSPERLEALRHDNPLAGFNPGWDIRRLWLTSFTEQNRKCTITGLGKTNEDVAEFLRRLALSDLFEHVTLQSTAATTEPLTHSAVVGFTLSCQVRY